MDFDLKAALKEMSEQEIARFLAGNRNLNYDLLKKNNYTDARINQEILGLGPDDYHMIVGQDFNEKAYGDVQRGLIRGGHNVASSLGGMAALGGDLMERAGADGMGQAVQNYGMGVYQDHSRAVAMHPKDKFSDSKIGWALGTIAEQVPIMADVAMTAGATALTGGGFAVGRAALGAGSKIAAGKVVKSQAVKQAMRRGAKIGAAGAIFPLETGGMYGELRDEHGVKAPLSSAFFGSLATAVEFLPGSNLGLVDGLLGAAKKSDGKMMKSIARELMNTIPSEMAQEGMQEILAVLNVVANTDEKFLTQNNFLRVLESSASGGLVGGVGGTGKGIVRGLGSSRDAGTDDSGNTETGQAEPDQETTQGGPAGSPLIKSTLASDLDNVFYRMGQETKMALQGIQDRTYKNLNAFALAGKKPQSEGQGAVDPRQGGAAPVENIPMPESDPRTIPADELARMDNQDQIDLQGEVDRINEALDENRDDPFLNPPASSQGIVDQVVSPDLSGRSNVQGESGFEPGQAVSWRTKKGQAISGTLLKKKKKIWTVKKENGKKALVNEKELSLETPSDTPASGTARVGAKEKQISKEPAADTPSVIFEPENQGQGAYTAKEPWRMSKQEFSDVVYNGGYDFEVVEASGKRKIQGLVKAYHATTDPHNKPIAKAVLDKAIDSHHRSKVLRAHVRGTIPDNVLADYPDLTKTASQKNARDFPDTDSKEVPQAEVKEGNLPAKEPDGITESPEKMVSEKVVESLERSQKMTSKMLFKWADDAYGGTQGQGAYTVKDAYDAMELGMNQQIAARGVRPDVPVAEAGKTVDAMQAMTGLLPTQTKRTKEQNEFQQFSTPPALAYVANWIAKITDKDVVVEPSAGIGGIAVFAKNTGATVVVNEFSKRRAGILKEVGFDRVFTEDAAQLDNVLPEDVRPTVIVMNPPFSSTAGRTKKNKTMNGARHIEQALARLEPGGRLVAVVGQGMAMDAPAFAGWWKEVRSKYNVRANIGVSGKDYAKYGTTFDNQLLVIDKAGKTDHIVTGKVDSFKDLIPALEPLWKEERHAVSETDQSQQSNEPRKPGSGQRTEADERAGSGVSVEQPSTHGVGNQDRESLKQRDPERRHSPVDGHSSGKNDEKGVPGSAQDPAPGTPGTGVDSDTASGRLDTGTDAGLRDRGLGFEQKERVRDEISDSVYDQYLPNARLKNSKPHITPLVESAAMADTQAPDTAYIPNIPKSSIEQGKLTDAQLEAVIFAGTAHGKELPSGERKGFFIGDGTGVGKGREIAGIIWDNWRRGNKKAIWLSEKSSLLNDAKRDLAGIGWDEGASQIFSINKTKLGERIKQKKGILFTQYATLRGKFNRINADESKTLEDMTVRLSQIVDWVGKDFDGVIAFDEAHNMGNALPMKGKRGEKKPSNQALAGVLLQELLPKARVVYVSATGATEVQNLAYAPRLGLWGEGTPFSSVIDFVTKIAGSGVSAMELVARDMKSLGSYLARSLSYADVKYERLEHKLTRPQVELYDAMAQAWQQVLANIDAAIEATEGGTRQRSQALSQFWGAHQRFFNQIITAMQMPSALKQMEKDIKAGYSIVIQLVDTNAQQFERKVAEIGEEGGLEDIDMTPRESLMQFLDRSFPTEQWEKYTDEYGNTLKRPVLDSRGKPVQNREAFRMKQRLIEELGSLSVPETALDMILHHFGPDMVAEVTGRKRRIVPDKKGDKVLEKWSDAKCERDIRDYLDNKKQILVFSEKGGTGSSYHAALDAKNQRLRRHYLVQPGWRADKAVQGLGRSHRSFQKQAPEFILVTTDLPGQKRFLSSIARRLDQLGALTKGQRQTGSQGIFAAKDNLESSHAADALQNFIKGIVSGRYEPDISVDEFQVQTGLALVNSEGETMPPPKMTSFLNRILSMTKGMQDKTFDLFSRELDQVIDRHASLGTLDVGLETVTAHSIEKVRQETAYENEKENIKAEYVQFKLLYPSRYLSFEDSVAGAEQGYFINKRSGKIRAADRTRERTHTKTGEVRKRIMLRNPKYNVATVSPEELAEKWEPVSRGRAKSMWNDELLALPKFDETRLHLLTGTLLPLWDRLQGRMSVARLQTDKGERFLGRKVDPDVVNEVLGNLGMGRDKIEMTGEQIADNILAGGRVTLSSNTEFKRSRVAGENRIEYVNKEAYGRLDGGQMEKHGLFSEVIQWKTRWFVPSGDGAGAVIDRVMAGKDIVAAQRAVQHGSVPDSQFSVSDDFNQEINVVDGDHKWLSGLRFDQIRKKVRNWALKNIRGHYKNEDTGWEIDISRKGIYKAASGKPTIERFQAIKSLPELINQAVRVVSRPDRSGDVNIKKLHRFFVPLKIGENLFVVKLTIKETVDGNKFYDHSLTEIEKPVSGYLLSHDLKKDSEHQAPQKTGSTINLRDLLIHVNEDELKYSVGQFPGQGVSFEDIQKRFKGQDIFLSPDGSISIRLKNGKGLRVKNVKSISGGDYAFAIETGRMGKDGVILGKYKDNEIILNQDLASNFTRDHELYHFLVDTGILSPKERLVVNAKFNAMKKRGQLRFRPNRSREENEANLFAQLLEDREQNLGTRIGRILQRIADFIDAMIYLGRASVRKIAREVERGDIFSRDSSQSGTKNGKFQTAEDLEYQKTEDSLWQQAADFVVGNYRHRKDLPEDARKDISALAQTFKTTMYNANKIGGAAKRAFNVFRKQVDWKFEKQNEILFDGEHSLQGVLEAFRKADKKGYAALNEYFVNQDVMARGHLVRETEEGRFALSHWKKKNGKRIPLGEFNTEDEAWAASRDIEADESGLNERGREALKSARQITRSLYKHYAQEMMDAVESYKKAGMPIPEVTTVRDGKTVQVNLEILSKEMGDRQGYYFPRLRQSGQYRIAGRKGNRKEHKYFDTRTMANQYRRRLERKGYKTNFTQVGKLGEDIFQGLEPLLSLQQAINRTLGEMSNKDKERILEDRNLTMEWQKDVLVVKGSGLSAEVEEVLRPLGGEYVEKFERMAKGMKYSPEVHFRKLDRSTSPEEIEEQVTRAVLYSGGLFKDMDVQFAEAFARQFDAVLKGRGSRARMIRRGDARGDEVSRGYEEDLITALIQATNAAAGGYAKGRVSREATAAITGRDISWEDFKEKNGGDHLKNLQTELAELELTTRAELEQKKIYQAELRKLRAGLMHRKFITLDEVEGIQEEAARLQKKIDGITRYADPGKAGQLQAQINVARTGMFEAYQKLTRDRSIQADKQGLIYKDITATLKDILKNDEAADRIIGALKGIAVWKYLGFRVSSAAINLTNMVTGVPAAMAGESGGKISIGGALRHIGIGMVEYGKSRKGKSKYQDLFDDIHRMGFDEPKFNREAFTTLQSKLGRGWSRFLDYSMVMFGATEKLNRAATIAGTYLALKDKHKGAWDHKAMLLKAREISDFAHGLYEKANRPYHMRGDNIGARTLQMAYVFQTFTHNYIQEMLRLGLDKKQHKAALYMALSPAVFGLGATVPMGVAKMVADLFGGDDPEEILIKLAEDNLGLGNFARYGITGLGEHGISLKGSLATRFGTPESFFDIFGAPGNVVADFWEGGQNISKGYYQEGFEKIAPAAFANISRGLRESTEGVTTRSGTPVFFGDEPLKGDSIDMVLRVLSFNPTHVSKKREIQWNEYKIRSRYTKQKAELFKKWKRFYNQPQNARNEKELLILKAETRNFNETVRRKGFERIVPKITGRSIKKAIRSTQKPPKQEKERGVE